MNIHPLYKRVLCLVLFLLPDESPVTRRAVMRAGVWMSHQKGELSLAQRKRLVTGRGKAHKASISIGTGALMTVVQHPLLSLLGFLLFGWGLWIGISTIVEWGFRLFGMQGY